MRRTQYKGHIIDTDNLGRTYIHNQSSPYSEDSDHIIIGATTVKAAKKIIDIRLESGQDIRQWCLS